jgi:hypothetical protein
LFLLYEMYKTEPPQNNPFVTFFLQLLVSISCIYWHLNHASQPMLSTMFLNHSFRVTKAMMRITHLSTAYQYYLQLKNYFCPNYSLHQARM